MNKLVDLAKQKTPTGYQLTYVDDGVVTYSKKDEATDKKLNISGVINQRELLISFLTWVREDYREDISIEYLVDYWLDKRNQ